MSLTTPLDYNAFERPHCYLRDAEKYLHIFLVIPLAAGKKVHSVIEVTIGNIRAITIKVVDDLTAAAGTYVHSDKFLKQTGNPAITITQIDITTNKYSITNPTAGTNPYETSTYTLDTSDAINDGAITILGTDPNQYCALCPYLYLGKKSGSPNNEPKVMIYLPDGYSYSPNAADEKNIDAKINILSQASNPGWYFPKFINTYGYPFGAVSPNDYYEVEVSGVTKPPAGTNKQKNKLTGSLPFIPGGPEDSSDLHTIQTWK